MPFVISVYLALAQHGLFYIDFHRGNLDFTGIEGTDPNEYGPEDEQTD